VLSSCDALGDSRPRIIDRCRDSPPETFVHSRGHSVLSAVGRNREMLTVTSGGRLWKRDGTGIRCVAI
jgi:hypothetical protein